MKKWICMLLSVAILLCFAACGEDETDQPEDGSSIQQSGSGSNEEGTQQSDSGSDEETEPAGA